MRALSSWPRPLLLSLAAVWAAVTIFYSAIWMYGVRVQRRAYLGVEVDTAGEAATLDLRGVAEGSPAQRAGLRAGDRILALNGRPLTPWAPLLEAVGHARPGDRLRLLVARPGATAPLLLEAVMATPPSVPVSRSRRVAQEFLGSYPILFLAVAIPVLLLRVEDRNAWLLAMVFAGFIAAAPLVELNVAPSLRGFALAYKIAFYGCWPAAFLYFFAVFPAPSAIDRRLPWLKRLWLTVGLAVSVPLAGWALAAGSREALVAFAESLVVPVRIPAMLYYFGG